MKYLSDYTEAPMAELWAKNGAFWAFSNKQFDEQKKPGVKYVQLMNGLVCPDENALAVMQGMIEIGDQAVAQDIAENGIEGVIKRELANHEAYYTGSIDSTMDALEPYSVTRDQVKQIFKTERANYEY